MLVYKVGDILTVLFT